MPDDGHHDIDASALQSVVSIIKDMEVKVKQTRTTILYLVRERLSAVEKVRAEHKRKYTDLPIY